jgi:hypothetical protein
MIVFDLRCEDDHVFEAWFGSGEEYEDQHRRGLVSCPICASALVRKAPAAPRISGTGDRATTEQAKHALSRLAALQTKLLAGSEHVGSRFADVARAMQSGEEQSRPVHGQASAAEARALVEEGVPILPLPLPVRTPSSDH